jgi:hypothetical protein
VTAAIAVVVVTHDSAAAFARRLTAEIAPLAAAQRAYWALVVRVLSLAARS